MAKNIYIRYREAFAVTPPPTAAIGHEMIAVLLAKMETAITRREPLTPKDFGLEEWYLGLEDGVIY